MKKCLILQDKLAFFTMIAFVKFQVFSKSVWTDWEEVGDDFTHPMLC